MSSSPALALGSLAVPQYESSSEDMRAKFESHGEIKTFFDLIKTRGMVFVTYVCPPSSVARIRSLRGHLV